MTSRIWAGPGVASAGTISSPVEMIPTTGRRKTLTRVRPERREHARVLGPQRPSGRQHGLPAAEILAGGDEVLAGRDRAEHLDGAGIQGVGMLEHDDGVRPGGEHAAGGDAHRLAGR